MNNIFSVLKGQSFKVKAQKGIVPGIPPIASPTPTQTSTPTKTPTQTPTPTNTPSITPTMTQTPTMGITPSITRTPSNTPTMTPTGTPGATLTPTATPQITPSNTQTPTATPVNKTTVPFKYLIARYTWNNTGTDFDILNAINNIPGYTNNYVPVGFCRASTIVGSLSWGGDVKGATGSEYTALDYNALSAVALAAGATTFDMGLTGQWSTNFTSGAISLEVTTYLGGTIAKSGTVLYATGPLLQTFTLQKTVNVAGDCTITPRQFGKITFNINDGSAYIQ